MWFSFAPCLFHSFVPELWPFSLFHHRSFDLFVGGRSCCPFHWSDSVVRLLTHCRGYSTRVILLEGCIPIEGDIPLEKLFYKVVATPIVGDIPLVILL